MEEGTHKRNAQSPISSVILGSRWLEDVCRGGLYVVADDWSFYGIP